MGTIWRAVSVAIILATSAVLTGDRAAAAQDHPLYLALGDSIAFGVGAANPAAEGYVGLAHFDLTAEDGPYPDRLDLLNLAEPGATSGDLLAAEGQLEKALNEIAQREDDSIPGNEVELISIDVGGNDLLALADADSPCLADTSSTECRDAITRTLSDLQDNLGTILERLRAAAPDAGIYAINLYNPYSGTGDPREVLASVAVQQVNGVINATAADPGYGARLVPIFELFLGRGGQWIASDQIHPNDDGHRVIAEALVAAIEERSAAVPEDLASVPTGSAGLIPGLVSEGGDEDGGASTAILVIAVLVAFAAGLTVSAVYFWTRGRPA
jgi:lysophospholipase L1-like esterase